MLTALEFYNGRLRVTRTPFGWVIGNPDISYSMRTFSLKKEAKAHLHANGVAPNHLDLIDLLAIR